MNTQSSLEDLLLLQVKASGLPEPITQFRWHPTRKWRADLCWPESRLIVEVQGATWVGGRHTSGGGYRADCEKLAEAQCLGYRVVYATGEMIHNGLALTFIERMLADGKVVGDVA